MVVLPSQLFVVFGELLPEVLFESECLKWSLGCDITACLLREELCISDVFLNELFGLTWLWEYSEGVAILSRVERRWWGIGSKESAVKFEYPTQPHEPCKLLEVTVKVRDDSSVCPRTSLQ